MYSGEIDLAQKKCISSILSIILLWNTTFLYSKTEFLVGYYN